MPLHGKVQIVRLLTTEKRWFDRLLYFKRLVDTVQAISGDIVECGVCGGESLGMLASLVRSSGVPRRIWAFDSWSGLPSPSPQDQTTRESFAGQLEFEGVSVADVIQTLDWYGFSAQDIREHITLVKGYFSETLAHYIGCIALAHIDADLYESYRDTLNNLWPKLKLGGVVALDEYHDANHWPGAKRAVDEFMNEGVPGTLELHEDKQYGRYYLVKLA